MTEPRVAFVTGASRGIGKAAAIALAEAGLDVVITGRTVREGDGVDDSDGSGRSIPGSLETTADAIEATGRRALPVVMDLHDRATLGAAVQRALDEWGHIDVLVNNAIDTGPGDMTRFEDTPIELIRAMSSVQRALATKLSPLLEEQYGIDLRLIILLKHIAGGYVTRLVVG